MAAPDPNKPLGDRDRVEREVGARVGYGWIWIWIAIIIILVIWFGGFGWGGYGGWWWGDRPQTAVVSPNAANGNNAGLATQGQSTNGALGGAGVQILTSTNKQAFIGKPFSILEVPVQQTNGNQAFWIGANNIPPMLVVLEGNNNTTTNADIQQGSRVNVTGKVARAPSAADAKRMWKLSDDDANRLEQQGAYVQASQVQSAQPQNQPAGP